MSVRIQKHRFVKHLTGVRSDEFNLKNSFQNKQNTDERTSSYRDGNEWFMNCIVMKGGFLKNCCLEHKGNAPQDSLFRH